MDAKETSNQHILLFDTDTKLEAHSNLNLPNLGIRSPIKDQQINLWDNHKLEVFIFYRLSFIYFIFFLIPIPG